MSRIYRDHGHSPYDLGVSDDKLFPFSHQLTDDKSAVSRHERTLLDSPLETMRQLFYGMGNGTFGDLGDFKDNATTHLLGRTFPPKRAFDTQEPWKLFTNSDAMITNGWFVLVPNGMTTTSGRAMSVQKPAVEKLQFSQELCGLDECRVDPALRDYLESEGRRFLSKFSSDFVIWMGCLQYQLPRYGLLSRPQEYCCPFTLRSRFEKSQTEANTRDLLKQHQRSFCKRNDHVLFFTCAFNVLTLPPSRRKTAPLCSSSMSLPPPHHSPPPPPPPSSPNYQQAASSSSSSSSSSSANTLVNDSGSLRPNSNISESTTSVIDPGSDDYYDVSSDDENPYNSDDDDNDENNFDPLTSHAVYNRKRRQRIYLFSFRELLNEVFRRYLTSVLETRENQQPGGVGFENLVNLLIAEIEFGFWAPDSGAQMSLDIWRKEQISKCQPLFISESEKYKTEEARLIGFDRFKLAPRPNADQLFLMGCWDNFMTTQTGNWERRPIETEPCLPVVHPSKSFVFHMYILLSIARASVSSSLSLALFSV